MPGKTEETKNYKLGDFLDKKFETPNRIGCAEFIKENLTIRIYGVAGDEKAFFEIDMERADFNNWLRHLERKSWATSEMIGDFVRLWIAKEKEAFSK